MALTLTPNGVTCCSHGGVNPWVKRQLYKSPEGAICVSTLGKTERSLMPPSRGLMIDFNHVKNENSNVGRGYPLYRLLVEFFNELFAVPFHVFGGSGL